MLDAPLLSVIIPTYNRAHLLGKTLDSVYAQTYDNYEIIVVDNCSSDDTATFIQRYAERGKLRFIQHDRNYGQARSRNTGMEHATGEYVTFLDSDDLMLPDNLRDAADYARVHPDARCFHNAYMVVDERGNRLSNARLPSLSDQHKAIAEGNFLGCIGNFVHREIYQRYRFDLDPILLGSEDWYFWLTVLADYKLGRIPRVNSALVDHSQRIMNNEQLARMQRRVARILERIRQDPHLSIVYRKYMGFMVASRFLFLAGVAIANRQRREALQMLGKALTKDPRIMFSRRFARNLLCVATLRS